jgi:hypothetical protein
MAHPRKLIRQAAVAVTTNATVAGARVYGTRVAPIRKTGLPAIAVYTEDEEVDQDSATTAPRELKRNLDLVFEAFVAHTDALAVDDAMDDIAEQIEAAMDANRYLNGTAGESILVRTETGIADGSADPLIGVAKLTYAVTYRTSPAVVGGNLADFTDANVTTNVVGGVADTVPAVDDFNPQEAP